MTLTASAPRPVEQRLTNLLPFLANVAYTISLALVLLLAWGLSSRFGWLPQQILPAPEVVWATIVELWRDGSLIEHTLVSLRVAAGFSIGALSGLLAGAAPARRQIIRLAGLHRRCTGQHAGLAASPRFGRIDAPQTAGRTQTHRST